MSESTDSFPPGELPGRQANIDPQLDTQWLFNRFLESAAAIEDPADRVLLVTDHVAVLQQNNPASYEQAMALTKQALQELKELPEHTDKENSYETIVSIAATRSLDEELIAQTDERTKNMLLVELAVVRRDSTLVPATPKSQDAFWRQMAETYGDIESARKVIDLSDKAKAMAGALKRIDPESDPIGYIQAEEEAWLALQQMPPDKWGSHKDSVASFAARQGMNFIDRIQDLETRHKAYKIIADRLAQIETPEPSDIKWFKDQVAHTFQNAYGEVERKLATASIYHVSGTLGLPEVIDALIPVDTEGLHAASAEAHVQKAVRGLDSNILLEIPSAIWHAVWLCQYDEEHVHNALKTIAIKTGDADLARKITDPFYRIITCSKLAGTTNDPSLKVLVQDYVMELLDQGHDNPGSDYEENWMIPTLISDLQDSAISRSLLNHPRVTSRTIAEIAIRTGDIDLALHISNPPMLEYALTEMAGKYNQPSLLDVAPKLDAHKHASAYARIYQAITRPSTD